MNQCLTKSGSPDAGKPCIFPFTYNSITYTECAEETGMKWCATEVDADGIMVDDNKRGICNPACPGGRFEGPSDVGGTCSPGSIHTSVSDSRLGDLCCCDNETPPCCWRKCEMDTPPQACLPPGARWKQKEGFFNIYEAAIAGCFL